MFSAAPPDRPPGIAFANGFGGAGAERGGDRARLSCTAGCGLRAAGCGLRAAGCGLRAAGCGLRAAGCGLRAAGCGEPYRRAPP
ncbi:hypothetical protein SCWH03_33060 [Streptomyces pacificus]|uniref:Uncharacterized protein n=1 Tax=Streptomyces pacificus TaxID=2705029 RepID=A0A6A0AW40_9ACTN|nr:hypothetical protein SCWH03_33060 [Streptomyces pacificus]